MNRKIAGKRIRYYKRTIIIISIRISRAGVAGRNYTDYIRGYKVRVFDLLIYKVEFEKNIDLEIVKGDIRDTIELEKSLHEVDHVIHLACISNDPSFELDPSLGKSINFDPFEKFVKMWEFYMASCTAAFRYRDLVVFQLQIVKKFQSARRTRDYIYS